jgi:hypothetical protein
VPLVAAATASFFIFAGGGAMADLEAIDALGDEGLCVFIEKALQPSPVEGRFPIR